MDQDEIIIGDLVLNADDDISNINISDVIDVIRTTDPSAQAMFNSAQLESTLPLNIQQSAQTQQSIQNTQLNNTNQTVSMNSNSVNNSSSRSTNAYVKITEQPASKALRFRYECEVDGVQRQKQCLQQHLKYTQSKVTGRSAGSIPGVCSTPENKTFPSIKIEGYRGRAVVVVSCVTKDAPFRPHPHSLVGKEGCKKGVCTVEINNETMSASFSNLGVQCVKKKDIEDSLRVRESIRVDPFRTGFSHRSQPSSIDLNAVRLCFQVFLENPGRERTSFTIPLPPVVSDPIYDKKAMSDLVICKLSEPSCTVAGGRELILLCEKVAKEDIAVRFFEEKNGQLVWEGYGDFQHTNVHKQVAIAFRTPKYRTIDIEQPVKCFIQLKRPSDGVASEPLPFEYLPLDSGRRSMLAFRKGLKEKGNVDWFKHILSLDNEILGNKPNGDIASNENLKPKDETKINEIIVLDTPNDDELVIEKTEILTGSNIENEPKIGKTTVLRMDTVDGNDKTTEWLERTEFVPLTEDSNGGFPRAGNSIDDDKTLNDLLEQVAELDEIYSDHQVKRGNVDIEDELNQIERILPKIGNEASMDFDDLFDDTATYTSLQKAFKNPVPIIDLLPPSPPGIFDPHDYDAVEPLSITNPQSPVIDISPLKRESPDIDEEKLPPLPPKRYRKVTASPENVENQAHIINKQTYVNESAPVTPERRNSIKSPSRPQSQIIIMRTPDQSPLNKRLPPTPTSTGSTNTLPKQKKSGFFSKLFSRRKSKSDMNSSQTDISPNISRESSINHFDFHDQNRLSTRSLKSPSTKQGKPVGRSVSSVSGKRPHLTADIVHIPLKGDSTDSLPIRSGSGNILAGRHSSRITLSNNLDRKTVSALQLADLPIQDGNMELIAIADAQSLKNLCEGAYGVHLDPDVDLTEAEHFALYTSVAPYATQSEFDEASCFYAPVENGEILTTLEVAQRLTASTQMDINK